MNYNIFETNSKSKLVRCCHLCLIIITYLKLTVNQNNRYIVCEF